MPPCPSRSTLAGGKACAFSPDEAARRFGWQHSPRQIVALVIAGHARLGGR